MPRRRRRARKNTRPAYPRSEKYTELFSFSCNAGSSLSLTTTTLSSLPPNRAFRIARISVQAVSSVAASCAIVVSVTEAANVLNTSRTLVLTPNNRTSISVLSPNDDFVSHTVQDAWQYGILEVICLHKGAQTAAYACGIVRVEVHFMNEQLPPACPSIHLDSDYTEIGASGSVTSSFEKLHQQNFSRGGGY